MQKTSSLYGGKWNIGSAGQNLKVLSTYSVFFLNIKLKRGGKWFNDAVVCGAAFFSAQFGV